MKIIAKRDWMDIKTQRNFVKGGTYEVDAKYGEKMVTIGHASEAKGQTEKEVEKPAAKKKTAKKK